MALAVVTLPFVVRAVQPVLIEVDLEAEEAAASLGEPDSRPSPDHPAQPAAGDLAGSALAFAGDRRVRSLVLLRGFIPFKTEVMSGSS
jgi:sulfate transport system permease protein